MFLRSKNGDFPGTRAPKANITLHLTTKLIFMITNFTSYASVRYLFVALAISVLTMACGTAKKTTATETKSEKPENCDCCPDSSATCLTQNGNKIASAVTIIYDFKSKQLSYPNGYADLERGDAVRIKVIHYNPFLYQVNIDGRDSSYKALVDNNNLLSSFMTLSNLSSIVAGLGQATVANAVANPTKSLQPQTIVNFAADDSMLIEKEQNKTKNPKDDPCRDNLKKWISDYSNKACTYTANFRDYRDSIIKTRLKWDDLFKSQRYLYPGCDDFKTLSNQSGVLLTDFTSMQRNISEMFKDITKDQHDYSMLVGDCIGTLRNKDYPELALKDSLIQVFFKTALSAIGTLDSSMPVQALISLRENVDRMRDITPCYTSGPLFLQGNSRIINLNINPWNDSFRLPHYPTISFEVPWTQKRIFGLSGGLYWSGLHSDQYSVITTDSVHHSITQNKTGLGEIGIDALAYVGFHISSKPKDYSYLGPSFGVGLSLENNPKPRGLLGLSYINGRTNRVLLTAGVTGGFVTKLSDVYQLNTNIGPLPTGITKNQFRANLFISFNYSFLN